MSKTLASTTTETNWAALTKLMPSKTTTTKTKHTHTHALSIVLHHLDPEVDVGFFDVGRCAELEA